MMGDGAFTEDLAGHKTEGYWVGNYDMKPAHKVTLDGYYLSKYEVTNNEYAVYLKINGKEWPPGREPHEDYFNNYPVLVPSWYEAKNYCAWVAKVSGLPFDLPTEAQWEYAARSGGQNYLFPTDNGKLEFGRNIKAYPDDPKIDKDYAYAPVGSNPPNPMGFHEMAANVSEWVNDWMDIKYYQHSPERNPAGPKESPYKQKQWKVTRGTSGINSNFIDRNFTTIIRGKRLPDNPTNGFRCSIQMKEKLNTKTLLKNSNYVE